MYSVLVVTWYECYRLSLKRDSEDIKHAVKQQHLYAVFFHRKMHCILHYFVELIKKPFLFYFTSWILFRLCVFQLHTTDTWSLWTKVCGFKSIDHRTLWLLSCWMLYFWSTYSPVYNNLHVLRLETKITSIICFKPKWKSKVHQCNQCKNISLQ